MAILDILKKKKAGKKSPNKTSGDELEIKKEKKTKELSNTELKKKSDDKSQIKRVAKKEIGKKLLKGGVSGMSYKILKGPHITEKANDLSENNQYIFKIWPRTNKIEVKKAIKEVFGKDVISVKIVKIPRKKRRMGKITGWKKGYKKAIIRLKEGQKIDILPQ